MTNQKKTNQKKSIKINWGQPVSYIEKQIKTFSPQPGIYCFWQINKKKLKLKILKARAFEAIDSKRYTIGKTLVAPQNELCVQCKEGFLIVEKLQLEGEEAMKSEKFIRSHPNFIGTILK